MSDQLNILLVRPWTSETERLRTSIRAAGLSTRMTRVDFPAALYAALSWATFDVVVFDPTTPSINLELLTSALRERSLDIPIVVMNADDIGKLVATQLRTRRN